MPTPKKKPAEPKAQNSKNLAADLFAGTIEKTFQDSPLVPESYLKPYNPDDLWQKKGDYTIYQQMLNDDQVDVCLQLKKDVVLGCGGEFVIEDDSQEHIKEDLEKAFYDDAEIPFDENLVVLDVRRPAEYADGHVRDALNIPLNDMIDPAALAKLEEEQNIYVHCAGGYRSVIAASILKKQGIHNIRNVLGGWSKIKELEKVDVVKEKSVLN